MGNFHISVLKKKILRVFLESGTKNIIINGLSVKEQFLYQMPSIVIKLHSNVTVILLLWKQVFLTTCKKRSAMWNCKMTWYNHALLIIYFVFISKLDNQFVNVSFVYLSSQMCQLVVHDSILVDNFEWEACIHVNSTALRGSLSLFGSWLSEWKYLMALKFQTWNSLIMLNNNNMDKRDNLTYAFSDKHIEKMFGNQF